MLIVAYIQPPRLKRTHMDDRLVEGHDVRVSSIGRAMLWIVFVFVVN